MKKPIKIKPTKNIKIIKFLKESKKEFDDFFNIKLSIPKVFLINSRKEFDKLWGKKSEPWMVGWAGKDSIYIFHPDKYVKESNHKNKQYFWKILKHECNLKRVKN